MIVVVTVVAVVVDVAVVQTDNHYFTIILSEWIINQHKRRGIIILQFV